MTHAPAGPPGPNGSTDPIPPTDPDRPDRPDHPDRLDGPDGRDGPGGRPARLLLDALWEASGDALAGVILFGSRLVGAEPSRFSAYDFVVVVRGYRPFYDAFVAAGHHRRSPASLARLSRVLAPSVLAFTPDLPEEWVAKLAVVSREDFRQALSPDARDHFLKGRMAQQVAVLHGRDQEEERWLETRLHENRRDVLRWAGPFLEAAFSPGELALRMLEVSYRGEIRPEPGDRAREVYAAQQGALDPLYRSVLEEAREEGRVASAGEGRYAFTRPPSPADRRRVRRYFLRSKVRATLRWLKHVLTFDDWLTYIQRKVERRTGRRVELTSLERKYPFIFLWPKAVRVLRSLPDRRLPEDRDSP